MECQHCHEPKPIANRGLCAWCYRSVRHLYPAEKVAKPLDAAREVCRRCRERNAAKYKRGLCSRCWHHHRDEYRRRRPTHENNETMEELEALIASRLPTMPKEPRYERQEDFVPQTVSRGLGVYASSRRESR